MWWFDEQSEELPVSCIAEKSGVCHTGRDVSTSQFYLFVWRPSIFPGYRTSPRSSTSCCVVLSDCCLLRATTLWHGVVSSLAKPHSAVQALVSHQPSLETHTIVLERYQLERKRITLHKICSLNTHFVPWHTLLDFAHVNKHWLNLWRTQMQLFFNCIQFHFVYFFESWKQSSFPFFPYSFSWFPNLKPIPYIFLSTATKGRLLLSLCSFCYLR